MKKKLKLIEHIFICMLIFILFAFSGCAHRKKLDSLEILIELNKETIDYMDEHCPEVSDETISKMREKLEDAKKSIKK